MRITPKLGPGRPLVVGLIMVTALAGSPPPAQAVGSTELISASAAGVPAAAHAFGVRVSASGRYVVFSSDATNLVPGPAAPRTGVYLKDRTTGKIELVSVNSAERPANLGARHGPVSADGRYVLFESYSTNLVSGDTNEQVDVFLRDRVAGTTRRVNVGTGGRQANGMSFPEDLSPDGRYAVFTSEASNLVPGDTNGELDVYVRDLRLGRTVRVSDSVSGAEPDDYSSHPRVSANGRYVAFSSPATNLVPADGNFEADVFVKDLRAGRLEIIQGPLWPDATIPEGAILPSISADGRYVVYQSEIYLPDCGLNTQVYRRDRASGSTTVVSTGANAACPGNAASSLPSISPNGRYVVFQSTATNLVPPVPIPPTWQRFPNVFVRDLQAGTTTQLTLTPEGVQVLGFSGNAVASDTGAAFTSDGAELMPAPPAGAEIPPFVQQVYFRGF